MQVIIINTLLSNIKLILVKLYLINELNQKIKSIISYYKQVDVLNYKLNIGYYIFIYF